MMTTKPNDMATREASSIQESRIAKKFGGQPNPSSGSGKFVKSDVTIPDISMSIECKTVMTPKESFSIKKAWLEKHKQEAFSNRLSNAVLAFNFYYNDKEDYYIINDRLMHFLVDKLREEIEK